jgi:L-ascorbate metabolism protein UlaG (beta-lactamase superfamily)
MPWPRIPAMFPLLFFVFVFASISTSPAQVQKIPSTCLAIARSLPAPSLPARFVPKVTYAALAPAALTTYQVRISYQGHSTYLIESASGVSIATDFTGFIDAPTPQVVTMNHAHDSHYTDYPDPGINHVLRGWNPQGGVAKHHLAVDDVLIRNVTTDIIAGNLRIEDDNSIFIFEVAGLCIGHLGHLHHDLSDEHYAKIGRLDVVMVPIDGAMTLSLGGMAKIVKRLRSRVILPMHARGWATPSDFIALLGEGFDHKYLKSRDFVTSLNDLPDRPTVVVPSGL